MNHFQNLNAIPLYIKLSPTRWGKIFLVKHTVSLKASGTETVKLVWIGKMVTLTENLNQD